MNEESKVVIRKAVSDDAPLLAMLNVPIHKLHSDARPDLYRPRAVDDPGITDFFAAALQNPNDTIFILEVDGMPAGCAYARVIHRPENPFSPAIDMVLVDQISVNPEFQSRGYGKALMQEIFALAKAHGIRRVVLDVVSFNESAIQFYERLGFRPFVYRMEIESD